MTEIKLFQNKVSINTDWNYGKTVDELKKQGVDPTITGGSWILSSIPYRSKGLSKIIDILTMAEYGYFYEIDFRERKIDSEMVSVKKIYRSKWEKIHGLHDTEILWKIQESKK